MVLAPPPSFKPVADPMHEAIIFSILWNTSKQQKLHMQIRQRFTLELVITDKSSKFTRSTIQYSRFSSRALPQSQQKVHQQLFIHYFYVDVGINTSLDTYLERYQPVRYRKFCSARRLNQELILNCTSV